MVNYSPVAISVVKPGHPEKKIEVSANCTIRELRRTFKGIMEVEPERQLLVYNRQIIMDEHPETKKEAILENIVEFKGSVMKPNSTFETT